MKQILSNLESVLAYNKGHAYQAKKSYDRAIASYKKSIALAPSKEAYLNIATCYRAVGKDTSCYSNLVLANSLAVPYMDGHFDTQEYSLALSNLGLYHYTMGNDGEAIACYTRCLAIDPENYNCAFNMACVLLRQACSGKSELFDEAWTLYQERFRKTPPVTLKLPNPDVQLWDGSQVDSILVYAEQGYGDNLMFARYLPLLKNFAKRIFVQCEPSIKPLFSDFETVFDGRECDATHALPIASLAHIFPMMPGDWLAGRYLTAPASEEFNIGVVWCGNPNHVNDHNRSTSMHRFHVLAKYAKLHCLTPGFKGSKFINKLDIKDWEDTCRAIQSMDLVICVDTSVAHLAGCLGKECWMLQPLKDTDFRWGNHNTSHNPWYDSVKVYRNPNSWDVVFDNVLTDLKDRVYG
jgi:tetratricopeptide (TPR) repeat protein